MKKAFRAVTALIICIFLILPAGAQSLPEGHWLAGTSNVPDMVAASIAPETTRVLMAECGPAYLEQVGKVRVLHLKGSYRDMGLQHGTLMKQEVEAMGRLMVQVGTEEWNKNFAESMASAWNRTSPFIPEKYKEELQGLAEASGTPLDLVQGLSIFPELFHCSGFALFGKATADGSLLHGRVLDYMRDAGLDKYALIIIQEPEGANAFFNISYSGFIGSVTAMNAQHLAMGEMGGAGGESWDGMPMSLLLRECMETANTLEDMRRIITDSKRTCQYFYVISDAKADNGRGSAYGVGTSPLSAMFLNPGEKMVLLPAGIEDTILMSAGDRYNCLVDRVTKTYGKITPQVGLDIMARGVAMESNTHDALFKPATLECWVTYAEKGTPACNLPYTYLNLAELMKSKPAKTGN